MDNAQELIARLNHSGKKLSKSHRRIAECIVSHYDKAAFMTASRLGEYVGVSESTVVRFAAALGYEGYPQLQKALQELIRHRLTASQRFEMTGDMDHAQVLSKVLKADIQNIRATLDELNIGVFEEVVEQLLSARSIYVLGLRASAPLAQFLGHYLSLGWNFFLTRAPQERDSAPNTCQYRSKESDRVFHMHLHFDCEKYKDRSEDFQPKRDRGVQFNVYLYSQAFGAAQSSRAPTKNRCQQS